MKTYLVGGAVRDELLGKNVKDRDWVVVGATPADMLALGYEQVGADFPVFLHPETREEYALARIERKTGDGYHGFEVSTEDVSLEDDLRRRDLTINSIAKDVDTGEYIDPFDGIGDLKKKILRHTSDAFDEDPLRVVRLARFQARYADFEIHPDTWAKAEHLAAVGHLNYLPTERFWAEMQKAMTDANFWKFIEVLWDLKVSRMVSFFTSLWGVNMRRHVVPYAFAAPRTQNPFEVFVAITAHCPKRLEELKPSGDILKLAKNVANWRAINSPGDLLKTINRARGFNTPTDMMKLIDAILAISATQENLYCTLEQFVRAWHAAKRITAADLNPSIKGKEIGIALEELRLKAIKESLGGRRNE